jgi:hypothetical protein
MVGQVSYHAQKESLFHSLVACRSSRTAEAGGQVYVTVFSSPARQDDLVGRRGIEQRRNCCTSGNPLARSSRNGASASLLSASGVWKSAHARVAPGLFPPELVVQVKAWACELPATHNLPLSRWSTDDLAREVCQTGLVASVSGSTIWRWPAAGSVCRWLGKSTTEGR